MPDLAYRLRKPPWIRVKLASGETYTRLKALMRGKSLHTVCEEARCPNMAECWGCGTATFLILGDTCTRGCRFCAIQTGNPRGLVNRGEAGEVARAVSTMSLRHAVVTSVTRDDLEDGGAEIFAKTIGAIHECVEGCTVEVLIPDLKGSRKSLEIVVNGRPEILGHNMETVARLYPQVRPQAIYNRSLHLLKTAKELDPSGLTKSGFMVGLGETLDELLELMDDLRETGCDILTVGQYLRPGREQLPVLRYYHPEEFKSIEEAGYERGFRWVESGPLVRSSYHADAQARELRSRKGKSHG